MADKVTQEPEPGAGTAQKKAAPQDSVTLVDNRTGKEYEFPISYSTYPKYGASINCLELRKIKVSDDDFGLMTYDPGYSNTASCKSSITFVDGEKGILRYRGYPIEQLAEHSTYLETAYLILFGELPSTQEMTQWTQNITHHTMIHEYTKKFMEGFLYDAHPMGMLVGTVGALSTFYPNAKNIFDEKARHKQIWRLIAKLPRSTRSTSISLFLAICSQCLFMPHSCGPCGPSGSMPFLLSIRSKDLTPNVDQPQVLGRLPQDNIDYGYT